MIPCLGYFHSVQASHLSKMPSIIFIFSRKQKGSWRNPPLLSLFSGVIETLKRSVFTFYSTVARTRCYDSGQIIVLIVIKLLLVVPKFGRSQQGHLQERQNRGRRPSPSCTRRDALFQHTRYSSFITIPAKAVSMARNHKERVNEMKSVHAMDFLCKKLA